MILNQSYSVREFASSPVRDVVRRGEGEARRRTCEEQKAAGAERIADQCSGQLLLLLPLATIFLIDMTSLER